MKAVNTKLTELLAEAQQGGYLIPRFQRKFVWRSDQTCKLIDSIARNYPIGSMLTLHGECMVLAATPVDAMAVTSASQGQAGLYVLDGQQRLTSIVRAMLQADPSTLYYFDLDIMYAELVQEQTEDLDWVACVSRPPRRPRTFKPHELPCNVVLDVAESNRRVHDFLLASNKVSSEDIFQVSAKLTAVFETVRNYQIFSLALDRRDSEESICRIFETINNTGVNLSTVDLMVAKHFSPDFDLRVLLDTAVEATPACAALSVTAEGLLHAMNFHAQHIGNRRLSLSKSGLLKAPKEQWVTHLPAATAAFTRLHLWLKANRLTLPKGGLLPAALLNVLAAAEMASPNALERPGVSAILVPWILSTLWAVKHYDKATSLEDLAHLHKLFKAHAPKKTDLPVRLVRPLTAELLMQTKVNSRAYRLTQAAMFQDVHRDAFGVRFEDIGMLEDHHILPKSLCDKRNISPQLTNCIGNRTLLTKESNRSIAQDQLPSVYFTNIESQWGNRELLVQYAGAHFMSEAFVMGADQVRSDAEFVTWIRPRLDAIASAVNLFLGATPGTGTDEDEALDEPDSPDDSSRALTGQDILAA